MESIDLNDWIDAEQWREKYASSVFRTHASWTWFKRRHIKKLVESGVLILGRGRAGDTVHISNIAGVVQEIRLAESRKKLART